MNIEYNRASTHNHTLFSLDSQDTPEYLIQLAAKNGFQVVVITDHDTTLGIKRAVHEGNQLGITVIPGIEVTAGKFVPHVIGINVGYIPNGRGNDWTTNRIREEGGFAILAHPGTYPFYRKEITRLIKEGRLDGIERFNGKFNNFPGYLIEILNSHSQNVAALGGADSHHAEADILSAYTLFRGKTAEDFLGAIEKRATIPQRGPQLPWNRVIKARHLFGGLVLLPLRRITDPEGKQ